MEYFKAKKIGKEIALFIYDTYKEEKESSKVSFNGSFQDFLNRMSLDDEIWKYLKDMINDSFWKVEESAEKEINKMIKLDKKSN